MVARPVQAGYFDYDASGNSALSNAANSETDVANSDRGFAFNKAKNIFGEDSYTHPQALPAQEGTLSGIGKSKANTTAADMYRITGESNLQELRVGLIANLKMARAGVKLTHTPVRIIAVTHHLDATGHYTNTFVAISAESQMPPAITFEKPRTHPMPAEVIDNADPLGQGRVQVKFLGWKQTHSIQQTDWIRILTPDAGSSDIVNQNRGYVFIPEAGDQVMVDFEQNNPDRPFVQGSIFHAENGAGGFDTNHLKSIQTRSGNKIVMNDKDGSITAEDACGNVIFMDGKGNITISASSNNVTINAPKTMTLNATDIFLNASQNVNISAGANIRETASGSIIENAAKDYNLTANNIREQAIEGRTSSAKNIMETSVDSNEIQASKKVTFNSAQNIHSKSGEKSSFH